VTATDQLREILDRRIGVLDGSWGVPGMGEPMVPPGAPSFRDVHGSRVVGLSPGGARLRPRRLVARPSAEGER
jgi:hypothetical protein